MRPAILPASSSRRRVPEISQCGDGADRGGDIDGRTFVDGHWLGGIRTNLARRSSRRPGRSAA
ncbi:hypothetical protein [Streptomyces sp.]|uniref:hypothetical protein n=1 Tax=Streptomyces sp. TaxID=1931 RepID=UPI002D779BB0|nr:hypothetical protein [Streptomyces sp.]HET6353967.1 hypothetical protein [Streptomyces sp.]